MDLAPIETTLLCSISRLQFNFIVLIRKIVILVCAVLEMIVVTRWA